MTLKPGIIISLCIVFSIGSVYSVQGQKKANPFRPKDKEVLVDAPAVNIVTGIITTTSFEATFTPNQPCKSYYILASKASDMAMWAGMMQVTIDSLVKSWGILCHSDTTYTWTSMLPNTEYTIYALPCDSLNQQYPMQTLICNTLVLGGPGESIMTVDVTDIENTKARVIVTPNSETAVFFDGLITVAYFNQIGEDSAISVIKSSPYPQYQTDNWLWEDLTPGTEYYAIGIGKNANDIWGNATKVLFSTTTTSIKEVNDPASALHIFYSAFENAIRIQTSAEINGLVTIYDLQGKQLFSERMSLSDQTIIISDFGSGCYLVNITSLSGEAVYSKKLIIW